MRSLAAVAAVLALAGAAPAAADSLRLVDPFVGTQSGAPDFGTGGGAGDTFPGAVLPSGMVQFSPDTFPSTDDYAGGYSYVDHLLRGFSLTHFSGAGCAAFGDIPILPVSIPVSASPALPGSSDIASRYVPRFDHRHESASPGAYAVTLDPGSPTAIRAELTATMRTGDARLTFPSGRPASVLIGAGGSLLPDYGAQVAIDPGRREISGEVQGGHFCFQPTKYRVYFAARFSRPFAAHGTWQAQTLTPGGRTAAAENPQAFAPSEIPNSGPHPGDPSSGVQVGGYASFDTRRSRQVEMQVGVSFTSLAAARANLAAEASGHGFAHLRAAAQNRWRARLSAVTARGGSTAARRLLATSLYHAMIEPRTISDAAGTYPGMDGRVHSARTPQLTDISGWDIYRTQVPLTAILDPRGASALATSLVRDAEQSGCLPRWPYADQQTNVMTGDPSAGMIAGAYAFGARGFDARTALARLVAGATKPCHTANGDYTEREALSDLRSLGFIPIEDTTNVTSHTIGNRNAAAWGSVSTTLEDAVADAATADLAAALGERSTARTFRGYGADWRHLFDPTTGELRPRTRAGAWVSPFSPTTTDGYVEGDAAQYTWFVPQDPNGLIGAMGGPATARRRLDGFFTELNSGQDRPYAFLGNEPTLGTPWLYDWLGRPDLASSIVHRALLGLYHVSPGGMPGNDDGGTMSAWWVFGALGLYPAVPGADTLAISAPLFPDAVVRLPSGRLEVRAVGLSARHPAVVSATLDGRRLAVSRLHFASLARGRHVLVLRMGARERWATRPG